MKMNYRKIIKAKKMFTVKKGVGIFYADGFAYEYESECWDVFFPIFKKVHQYLIPECSKEYVIKDSISYIDFYKKENII